MIDAEPWLPCSALSDARTAAPVARAVREWSADWFAAGSLTAPPRWEVLDGGGDALGYSAVGHGDGFRLLVREDAQLVLAGLLLGRELEARECRTRQDRALIDYLVEVALAALIERLGDVLTPGRGAAAGQWHAMPLAIDGGSSPLRIEAASSALVALAMEWTGPPRRQPDLPSRRESLASQPLRLSARIGANRLSLAEIEALGVGDVLVLETPLSAAVDACIDCIRVGDAALSLVPDGNSLKLQIERPASQW